MKISRNRDEEPEEFEGVLRVHIGDEIYSLSESVDGKLTINKALSNNHEISVFPRYANEIEIK